MKIKKFLFGLGAAILLTGCQTGLAKSVIEFTDEKGAGSKTIYVAAYVDGSCQPAAYENGKSFIDASGISSNDATKFPACDTTKLVSTAKDGFLTAPSAQSGTNAQKWDATNVYIKSLIPTGFDYKLSTYKSAGWLDTMMEDAALNTDGAQWKVFLHEISYSFKNFDEYISKTKTLITAEVYDASDLKADDEANVKWAEWKVEKKACTSDAKKKCNVVSYKEKESVLWHSIDKIVDTFYNGDYFNPNVYGEAVGFDGTVQFSDIAVKIDGVEQGIFIDAVYTDYNGEHQFKTLTATLEFEIKPANMLPVIIGVAIGAVVVAGAVAFVILSKKKKAA